MDDENRLFRHPSQMRLGDTGGSVLLHWCFQRVGHCIEEI